MIRAIITKHGGAEPRVFGSVARRSDKVGSDVDILIKCGPKMSVLDLIHIQDELEALLGTSVDIVDEDSLPAALKAQIDSETVAL